MYGLLLAIPVVGAIVGATMESLGIGLGAGMTIDLTILAITININNK